jgi:hypothetical protein
MTTLTVALPFEATGLGGLTLAERLEGAWQEIQAQGCAACPVCGEGMTAVAGAGRCGGCGSELR